MGTPRGDAVRAGARDHRRPGPVPDGRHPHPHPRARRHPVARRPHHRSPGTSAQENDMTPTTPEPARLAVALSTSDVSVVFDVSDGALPAVVHWGERLELEPEDLDALVTTGVGLNGPNDIDEPRRVAVLPEQHRAWPGRPGLPGSRDGRAWSTRFVVDSILLDGEPVTGHHVGGPGLLEVHAVDDGGGAASSPSTSPSSRPAWCACGRPSPTSRRSVHRRRRYACPAAARRCHDELLDFAGRWARERVPQRSALHTGIHLRENRRGRTGADSAYVLHAGAPGLRLRGGRACARCTPAWSGNHVHYAERVFTGESRARRRRAAPARRDPARPRASRYTSPWLYGAYGDGLDEVARRFHRYLRARPRPGHRRAARHPQRLGGGLLRPRPRPAARPRRPGRRGRRRALRARRRLVRRPARRQRRTRRLGRLRRTSGRTGCTRSSTGCASSACSSACGSSRR